MWATHSALRRDCAKICELIYARCQGALAFAWRPNGSGSSARRHLSFFHCRHGSIGPLFALAVTLLVLAAGASIDVGRWLHARSQAQNALSAAVLAGGRMLQIAGGDRELAIASAMQAFEENNVGGVPFIVESLSFEVGRDGATFTARAVGWLPTTLLRIVRIDRLSVFGPVNGQDAPAKPAMRATSGASMGTSYEIAIALDLSDGMKGPILESLKSALSDLVDIVVWPVQDEATARIALVPFANAVNAGLSLDRLGAIVRPGICRASGCQRLLFRTRGPAGCSMASRDGAPASADCSARVFTASPCMVERRGTEAFTNAPPRIAPVGVFYPNALGHCRAGATVVPLSANREALSRAISGLSEGGTPAPHVGMAWAWYLLSPEWGYVWPADSQASSYRDLETRLANGRAKLRKIAILVQRGVETVQHCEGVDDRLIDCLAPNGRSSLQTRQVCVGMRRSGIAIYVVGVDLQGNREMEEVLRDHCAGRESAYYAVGSGSELRQAFRDIALQISTLVETQ